MARKTVWPDKIAAPEMALKLYRLVAALQFSTAFQNCHVYDGARDKTGIPQFKFEGRVHNMPYVIASFMGLQGSQKRCNTPGCMNPFHYAPPTAMLEAAFQHTAIAPEIGVDYTDLIDYYVTDCEIALNFEAMRTAIPIEDISDRYLRDAIDKYRAKKG